MRFLLVAVASLLAAAAVKASESELPVIVHEDVSDLPEEFDARTKWPHCGSIGTIFDQGSCHSSLVSSILNFGPFLEAVP